MGRPRDPDLDQRILAATRALIGELGSSAVTISAVAARAGVSRPTVYRRYPNRAVLVFAAETSASVDLELPRRGAFSDRLRRALTHLVAVMAASDREVASEQFARMIVDREFADEVWAQRWAPDREQVYPLWADAVAAGEVDATIDGRRVIDDLVAVCWFQVLLSHRHLTPDDIDDLVARVLHGVTPR